MNCPGHKEMFEELKAGAPSVLKINDMALPNNNNPLR
jgi:hypothetical protein